MHEGSFLLQCIELHYIVFQFIREVLQEFHRYIIFEDGLSDGRHPPIDELDHASLTRQHEVPVLISKIYPISGFS